MLSNEKLSELLLKRKQLKTQVTEEEWAARVELAACYRLIAHFRMTDWIYNHISSRVPGTHEHYLINPFGLLYEEVSASNLVKVDVHGNLAEDVELEVNPAAFVIHGAIHKARPDVGCVLHTHTSAGVAVAAQAQGLLPISQHAMRVYGQLSYHDFEGIALDAGEQERLIANIGNNNVLILRNHGLLTTGKTVPQAFELMLYLERACQIQISATSGTQKLTYPPDSVCQRAIDQFNRSHEFIQGRDWQALIRLLDRTDPSYKE
jgi:ribulose-5-phosphate 4-epimerase/fuculose-1-phosphate aldolase